VVPLDEPSRLPGTSWWDVPVPEVSGVSSVKEAREQYETALKRRKFYY
jgi:TPP-dependent trihydroxycyclohexane-1,2-dione (THcHDO) dehydratase